MRTGIVDGMTTTWWDTLRNWVQEVGFKGVITMTGTMSMLKRERHTNKQLPEVFSYCNNYLYNKYKDGDASYYSKFGVKKFGDWISEKKIKPHQELKGLMGGGGSRYIKIFNTVDVPCSLFVIFTPGGIDFVGGYTFYHFLKDNFGADGEPCKPLGKVDLPVEDGEQVHQLLFKDKKVITPVHWYKMIEQFIE